jgi:deferrochelatase/peroxidase EfeB
MTLRSHIQNLVANGFDTHCSRYFLLHVQQAAAARQFLRTLLDQGWVVSAQGPRPQAAALHARQRCPVGIGFTFAGLQALGLPTRTLRRMAEQAPAFAEGAPLRAAHRLADTGPSSATGWEPAFQHRRTHVFVTLHADDPATLAACSHTLHAMAGPAFEGWATPLDGAHLGRNKKQRREHFGYLDGLTNPLIDGIHSLHHPPIPLAVPPTLHAPGEFLLGHRNADGYNPWLNAAEPAAVRQFLAHGSFSALRKMAQDVEGFHHFVKHQPLPEATVRAKLLGRWDNGQVVSPVPVAMPHPATRAGLNNFDFQNDPHGLGCPYGAHIRRMNPRADAVVPVRKRPLIRRGIPYTADGERGLLGLFFCASLEDQFEHLLAEWGNKNPFGVPNPSTAKDPLIGNHAGGGVFHIPTAHGPDVTLSGFTPFVTTKGTLYSFFPSLPALAMLAEKI